MWSYDFPQWCIIVLLLSGIPGRAQVSVPSKTTGSAPAHSADFEQGKQLLAQGLWDQAISAVQRGLASSPHNLEGLNLLGVIYHQQGKYDEAAAVFHEALAIDPRSIDTLNNLGTSYAAQNKTDAAEQMFRKVLELQPKNGTANYNLGLLLLAQNKPKEAIVYLTRVASPDEAVRLNLVRAYLSAGMTSLGLATAEKLSQEHAKEAKVHFSLGILLGANQQYPQAVHELELANALQPEDFDILHDLGRAYLLGGQTEKAQTTLNQALRLQPDSADTLYLLAQTASEMQKDVDALELLVRARKIAPTNTDILFLMARLSMKQSFFEDAIELIE